MGPVLAGKRTLFGRRWLGYLSLLVIVVRFVLAALQTLQASETASGVFRSTAYAGRR